MRRVRLRSEPPLLDPERALRVLGDVKAWLAGSSLPEDAWAHRRVIRRTTRAAVDAVVVALDVAVDTGDPRLLAAAVDVVGATDVDHGFGLARDLADVAEHVLPHLTSITNRVRECARSPSTALRAATAAGLGPRALRALDGAGDAVDQEALGLVMALSKDADGYVRSAARDALGGRALPAWAAFFPADPLRDRSAEEATQYAGAIETAATLFDRGAWVDADALADALAGLPDDLARPFLDAFLLTRRHGDRAPELVTRWVRGATIDELAGWIRTKGETEHAYSLGAELGRAIASLGPARAGETCVALCASTRDARGAHAVRRMRDVLDAAWPEATDPTPLLDAIARPSVDAIARPSVDAIGRPSVEAVLGAPLDEDEDDDDRARVLDAVAGRALHAADRFPALLDALVAAKEAGYPGRWAPLADKVDHRLRDAYHPRLCAAAERALASGAPKQAATALAYLVGPGRDAERDPPRADVVRRAAEVPGLWAEMIGNAAFAEAAPQLWLDALASAEGGAAIRIARALGVGPDTTTPGVTAAHWDRIRAARDVVFEPGLVKVVAFTLPPAEFWSSADEAFYERFIERYASDEDPMMMLAVTLGLSPRRAWVGLAQRLVAALEDGEARDQALHALEACQEAEA